MKIMGIDYGDARTGVSISDPTGFLAGSPQVISTWNTEKLLDDLTALVQKEKIEEIVMGLPKNMNATQGERAENARHLAPSWKRAPVFLSSIGTNAARPLKPMRFCTPPAKSRKSIRKMWMPSQLP